MSTLQAGWRAWYFVLWMRIEKRDGLSRAAEGKMRNDADADELIITAAQINDAYDLVLEVRSASDTMVRLLCLHAIGTHPCMHRPYYESLAVAPPTRMCSST